MEILQNKRLLLVYLRCVLEDGPCSPEGKELKDHMKPALENGCADCSEKQIENVKKGTAYLIKERPDVWNKICEKLDPEGVYRKKYEEQAKQAGINYS
uniref:Chemosensory protein 19 n=1 Tax=Dendrolimus punctatus TaxID=238572 RepID=A0A2K8GL23_9NEOP|nr:Chemosensory protein 19 [Dendrolimus punctatus]